MNYGPTETIRLWLFLPQQRASEGEEF